jgi:uncharacterized protein (TIRG00374 family)
VLPDAAQGQAPPTTSRRWLQYLVSAALTLFFLYLAFRGTDPADLVDALRRANYWWILANFLALMASHVLRALRWRYMLYPLKPDIGLRNLFSALMIGYMLNNILPRAGEIGRPYVIGKLERISAGASFGTIVVERIMDMVSFLILVAALPFLYRGPLRESFPWLTQSGVILAALIIPATAAIILLMRRRDWADAVLARVTRLLPKGIAGRIERLTHSFLDGFTFLKTPRHFLVIFVLSVLIWGLYAVMTWCGLRAFGLDQQLGYSGAIVVLAISSIGVAIPTPGSTGTYHAFASQTLIALFGVDRATALSFATLTHAVGFVSSTLFGLYFFLVDRITLGDAMRPRKQDQGGM